MTAAVASGLEYGMADGKPGARPSDSQDFQKLVLGCNKDGMDHLRKAQYKQAFEQLKYAESILAAKEGEDEPSNLLAVTCNNLGCYYKKVGKLHAALSYLRKALKIEVSLQTDDVTVAGTHLNICAILSKLEKHDKAVQHALCALELISNRVNSKSPDSVSLDEYSVLSIAYHNVAVERDYLHHWDQAAAAYQQGYVIAKRCLGDQHPLTQTLAKNSDAAAQKSKKHSARERGKSTATGAEGHQGAGGGLLPNITGAGSHPRDVQQQQQQQQQRDEPMPIPSGRSVPQEAEEWVQNEENAVAAWKHASAQQFPGVQGPSSQSMSPRSLSFQEQAAANAWRHANAQAAAGSPSPFQPSPLYGQGFSGMSSPQVVSPRPMSMQDVANVNGSAAAMQPMGEAMPTESASPWNKQPSFLDSIAQDVRNLHASMPSSPPPLVMVSREAQVQPKLDQQASKARDDATSDASPSRPLDIVPQAPRTPRPPRSEAGSGRPRPPRTTREQREAARKAAAAAPSYALTEQARDPNVRAPHMQLLRKTSAERIQRAWRTWRRHKQQNKNRAELERVAATMIQARWRAFYVQRRTLTKHCVVIQKWVRGFLVRNRIRKHKAAVTLQRHVHGMMVRKEAKKREKAAIRIQQTARQMQAAAFVAVHKKQTQDASLVLQRGIRMWKAKRVAQARRTVVEACQAQHRAATRIQSVFRGFKGRKVSEATKRSVAEDQARNAAATKVQALARRTQALQRVEAMRRLRLEGMNHAATLIQKNWLRTLHRSRYLDLRQEFLLHENSIVTIQRYVRGYLVRLRMWRDAIRAEEELWAAVEIQRCWRGYQGRLRWELAYEAVWSREVAAHRIQRSVRGWLARTRVHRLRKRLARAEFMKARRRFKAAQTIQAVVRGHQSRKRVWAFRAKKREAATRIQKVWRGHRLRCKLWDQVMAKRIVQIQAVVRGFLVRRRKFHFVAKVILIQRKYRHWLRFLPEAERQRRLNTRRLRKRALE